MRDEEYVFTGMITARRFGRMTYHVVYLPSDLISRLPLSDYPRLRVNAMVGNAVLNGALQPAVGRWYVLLSTAFMKKAKLVLGQEVEVSFSIAEQDAVIVPEDLQDALDRDAAAQKIWDALTPGRRRGMAHRVASALRPDTRAQRILEVLEILFNLAAEVKSPRHLLKSRAQSNKLERR